MILIVFCNEGRQSQSKRIKRIKYIDWGKASKSPIGAILLHSPGRKPWVYSQSTYLEPRRGGTPSDKYSRRKCRSSSELFSVLYVFTQGFISGFALISPWALQECRAYSTHNAPEFLTLKIQCTHRNKYDVLTDVSTRTYFSEYTHLNL